VRPRSLAVRRSGVQVPAAAPSKSNAAQRLSGLEVPVAKFEKWVVPICRRTSGARVQSTSLNPRIIDNSGRFVRAG
jgi:hypothetical protein